jgi:hypothetical protein
VYLECLGLFEGLVLDAVPDLGDLLLQLVTVPALHLVLLHTFTHTAAHAPINQRHIRENMGLILGLRRRVC